MNGGREGTAKFAPAATSAGPANDLAIADFWRAVFAKLNQAGTPAGIGAAQLSPELIMSYLHSGDGRNATGDELAARMMGAETYPLP
jgi:hypothetical protein